MFFWIIGFEQLGAAALGQKQSLTIISGDRLVSGV
jgi:hypothetical protein